MTAMKHQNSVILLIMIQLQTVAMKMSKHNRHRLQHRHQLLWAHRDNLYLHRHRKKINDVVPQPGIPKSSDVVAKIHRIKVVWVHRLLMTAILMILMAIQSMRWLIHLQMNIADKNDIHGGIFLYQITSNKGTHAHAQLYFHRHFQWSLFFIWIFYYFILIAS